MTTNTDTTLTKEMLTPSPGPPNTVDLRKRETCYVPLSGEADRLAFRTQGGAALTLGYKIQPFQGKKPPPKGVHILAQGKHPGVRKTIGPHSLKGI